MRALIRPSRIKRIILPLVLIFCVVVYLWLLPDLFTWKHRPTSVTREHESHSSSMDVDSTSTATAKAPSAVTLPQLKPPEPTDGMLITEEEISGGEPRNATLVEIRNQIREMTKHAWQSYVKYAWGFNELKPVSKTGNQPYVLGTAHLGATIIDAMDTLYIMGLKEEFAQARNYVATELKFDENTYISVFEATIRFLGGLLTSFTFTRDPVFLTKAVELVQRLMPAFDTPTKIPCSLVHLRSGRRQMFSWSRNRCAILAEAGTLHMEFKYLSELTGDPTYAELVDRIRQSIISIPRPNGLFYNYVDPDQAKWCGNVASLGALGDSFYEYLLKEWIRTDHADTQAWALYNSSMEAFLKNGLFRRSYAGNLYVGTYDQGTVSNSMDHLACFVGGMLALGSQDPKDVWFQRGVEITRTCNLSYENSPNKLGPDEFDFTNSIEAVAIKQKSREYLQRPETVESYFYLWRFTKNEDYRIAALKVVEALKKHCRTDGGFSGLMNTYAASPRLDDVQQSYFLAETLKYLYLIFSEDTLLPLDRWVFNTEAHPFPIHNHIELGSGVWPKSANTVQGSR